MEKKDIVLTFILGVISGLIVLLGSFYGEMISDIKTRLIVTISLIFIFSAVFLIPFYTKKKK